MSEEELGQKRARWRASARLAQLADALGAPRGEIIHDVDLASAPQG